MNVLYSTKTVCSPEQCWNVWLDDIFVEGTSLRSDEPGHCLFTWWVRAGARRLIISCRVCAPPPHAAILKSMRDVTRRSSVVFGQPWSYGRCRCWRSSSWRRRPEGRCSPTTSWCGCTASRAGRRRTAWRPGRASSTEDRWVDLGGLRSAICEVIALAGGTRCLSTVTLILCKGSSNIAVIASRSISQSAVAAYDELHGNPPFNPHCCNEPINVLSNTTFCTV